MNWLLRIELVGGPHDGRHALIPPACPCCGEPIDLGHVVTTPDGLRYVVEGSGTIGRRRTAVYERAVRA